jgi:thymidylate kinase
MFIGVEGSGKSTQINLLRSWLSKSSHRTKVVDIREKNLFAYILWKFLIVSGRYSLYLRPDETLTKGPDVAITRKTHKLWFLLQFASVAVLIPFNVSLPLSLGYVVISERFVMDTISDVLKATYSFGTMNSVVVKASLRLLSFIRKDSILIYLHTEYPALVERYRRRGTPAEWREYVQSRNLYYQLLLTKLGFSYISLDTTEDSAEVTFCKLTDAIQRYI